MADFDIVTVGGGVGGAAIAKAMAERGYRVLVTERETKFKDRVRGEWIAPWGVAEIEELGLHDALMAAGGTHTRIMAGRAGPAPLPPRDLVQTTALGLPCMTMYHPDLQECAIAEAARAGAEVRRGVKVTGVTPGKEPTVEIGSASGRETVTAQLVVGADGRNSMVRKWGGFAVTEREPQQWLSGVLLENCPVDAATNNAIFNPFLCQIAFVFPQGGGRARAYFGARTSAPKLQGDGAFQALIDKSIETGAPAEFYEGVRQAGPIASFDGYDSYAEHPYKDGLALVGDAAQTSDQTWGQGLSLTLRAARLLRDALLSTDDWGAAGDMYADAVYESYEHIRKVEDLMTLVFMQSGEEADAVRAKVLPRLAVDPTILPDTHMVGPELAPANEEAFARFFGE